MWLAQLLLLFAQAELLLSEGTERWLFWRRSGPRFCFHFDMPTFLGATEWPTDCLRSSPFNHCDTSVDTQRRWCHWVLSQGFARWEPSFPRSHCSYLNSLGQLYAPRWQKDYKYEHRHLPQGVDLVLKCLSNDPEFTAIKIFLKVSNKMKIWNFKPTYCRKSMGPGHSFWPL